MTTNERTRRLTTAIGIAGAYGLDPKSYRAQLRAECFEWHEKGRLWLVEVGSGEQRDMLRIAEDMAARR